MTPLQALERIIKNVNDYSDIDIEQELDTIAEALHVPTADDVCKELKKFFIHDVFYDKEDNDFYILEGNKLRYHIGNESINEVPYNILSLIARFFGGQE